MPSALDYDRLPFKKSILIHRRPKPAAETDSWDSNDETGTGQEKIAERGPKGGKKKRKQTSEETDNQEEFRRYEIDELKNNEGEEPKSVLYASPEHMMECGFDLDERCERWTHKDLVCKGCRRDFPMIQGARYHCIYPNFEIDIETRGLRFGKCYPCAEKGIQCVYDISGKQNDLTSKTRGYPGPEISDPIDKKKRKSIIALEKPPEGWTVGRGRELSEVALMDTSRHLRGALYAEVQSRNSQPISIPERSAADPTPPSLIDRSTPADIATTSTANESPDRLFLDVTDPEVRRQVLSDKLDANMGLSKERLHRCREITQKIANGTENLQELQRLNVAYQAAREERIRATAYSNELRDALEKLTD